MRKFSVKAVKIVLDTPLINAPGLIDAPLRISPKYFQFIEFLVA